MRHSQEARPPIALCVPNCDGAAPLSYPHSPVSIALFTKYVSPPIPVPSIANWNPPTPNLPSVPPPLAARTPHTNRHHPPPLARARARTPTRASRTRTTGRRAAAHRLHDGLVAAPLVGVDRQPTDAEGKARRADGRQARRRPREVRRGSILIRIMRTLTPTSGYSGYPFLLRVAVKARPYWRRPCQVPTLPYLRPSECPARHYL